MPKIIRKNVFETNSSSVHSISIERFYDNFDRYNDGIEELKKNIAKGEEEFGSKTLVIRGDWWSESEKECYTFNDKLFFLADSYLKQTSTDVFEKFIESLYDTIEFEYLVIIDENDNESDMMKIEKTKNSFIINNFYKDDFCYNLGTIDHIEGRNIFTEFIKEKEGVDDHIVGLCYLLNTTAYSKIMRNDVCDVDSISRDEDLLIADAKLYQQKLELDKKLENKINDSLKNTSSLKNK